MENAATLFSRSRVAWDSSTFSQNGLTNIKHYLYFFSLTLKIHESLNFLVPQAKHAALISMQDGKLFLTRLTFFISSFILFAFYLFLLSFSHEMSRFLRFFLYPYAFSHQHLRFFLIFFLTWIFFFLISLFFTNFLCIFTSSYVFIAPGPRSPA